MSDYVSIANAIKTTLQADSWIGNTANVKTIEIHRRGFSVAGVNDALFFDPTEMPAIAIIPNAKVKKQEQKTTNEIQETIKSQIVTVTQDSDAQTGMSVQQAIVKNIERVLEAQKSSANDLGIDAFIQQVSTTETPYKDGTDYHFISTTEAEIQLTATF